MPSCSVDLMLGALAIRDAARYVATHPSQSVGAHAQELAIWRYFAIDGFNRGSKLSSGMAAEVDERHVVAIRLVKEAYGLTRS